MSISSRFSILCLFSTFAIGCSHVESGQSSCAVDQANLGVDDPLSLIRPTCYDPDGWIYEALDGEIQLAYFFFSLLSDTDDGHELYAVCLAFHPKTGNYTAAFIPRAIKDSPFEVAQANCLSAGFSASVEYSKKAGSAIFHFSPSKQKNHNSASGSTPIIGDFDLHIDDLGSCVVVKEGKHFPARAIRLENLRSYARNESDWLMDDFARKGVVKSLNIPEKSLHSIYTIGEDAIALHELFQVQAPYKAVVDMIKIVGIKSSDVQCDLGKDFGEISGFHGPFRPEDYSWSEYTSMLK